MSHARYFGTELNDKSLTPGDNPHIGPTTYQDWLNRPGRDPTEAPGVNGQQGDSNASTDLCGAVAAMLALGPALAQDAQSAKVTIVLRPHPPQRSRQEHEGCTGRIRPGRYVARPYPSRIRLHLRDGPGRRDPEQVNDGPVSVYRAGESFAEMPGDHHAVSANASDTAPARPARRLRRRYRRETDITIDDPK